MVDRMHRSALLISLAAAASPVRADYACTQGSRDVTAAERAAMTSVLETVRRPFRRRHPAGRSSATIGSACRGRSAASSRMPCGHTGSADRAVDFASLAKVPAAR